MLKKYKLNKSTKNKKKYNFKKPNNKTLKIRNRLTRRIHQKGGVLNKDSFPGFLLVQTYVTSQDIFNPLSPLMIKKAMNEVNIDQNIINEKMQDITTLFQEYIKDYIDIYTYIIDNGCGLLSLKYVNNCHYESILFNKIQEVILDSSEDNNYSKFIRTILNIHLGENEDLKPLLLNKLLEYSQIVSKIKNNFDDNCENQEQFIKDYNAGMNLTDEEVKIKTSRMHTPSEYLKDFLRETILLLNFFNDNIHISSIGLLTALYLLQIDIELFKTKDNIRRPKRVVPLSITIVLTEEQLNYNSKTTNFLNSKFKFMDNDELVFERKLLPFIYETITIFEKKIKSIYLNVVDEKYRSEFLLKNIQKVIEAVPNEESLIKLKKGTLLYKGVSKSRLNRLNIDQSSNLIFTFLGFDPNTAALYSINRDGKGNFSTQSEFCEKSAGYIGEYEIVDDLILLNFKNKNIITFLKRMIDDLDDDKVSPEQKTKMKNLAGTILKIEDNGEVKRNSFYDEDFEFVKFLCENTQYKGYIYALNDDNTISDGLSPEVLICYPKDNIKLVHTNDMSELLFNCSKSLNDINPILTEEY